MPGRRCQLALLMWVAPWLLWGVDGAWGETEVAGRFAYLDTDPVGGLTIELLWSKE